MRETHPCTNPNPKAYDTGKKRETFRVAECCYTVSYAEDNQQGTNHYVKNGKNSDHRHRSARNRHFEAQNWSTLETL